MSSNHQGVQRLSDLTADIDLMKIPEKDTHTIRALCIFKKKPRKFGTPPHTVLIIEGLNEKRQHYFYEIDFVPIYENIADSAFLPSDLLQRASGLGRYIPWYLTPGKVRVRGYNIDFNFFNIAQPSSTEPYGYLPIREPNTLRELLRTKILLQRAAMLICVINKQTESALLQDIRTDFLRNATPDPLIYNFAGITVTQSSSSETNSAITVEQAIQRFQNHILGIADYHKRREHSAANSVESEVYSNYAQLLNLLSEQQKSQLQAMIKEEQLQPQSLQFSGSGHNCMTWTEEKVKKQGIDISWDFSLPIKVLSRIIHHPEKISIPEDISREKKRYMDKSKLPHQSLVPKPQIKPLVRTTTPLSSSVTPNNKAAAREQNKEKTPSQVNFFQTSPVTEPLPTPSRKRKCTRDIEEGIVGNLSSEPLLELSSSSSGSGDSSSSSSLGFGRFFFQTPRVTEQLPTRPRKRRCIRENAMSNDEIMETMACILSLHDNLTERSQSDRFIEAKLMSFNGDHEQDLISLIEWYKPKGSNLSTKELLIEPKIIYEKPDGLFERLQTIKKKLKDIEEESVGSLSDDSYSSVSSSSVSSSSSSLGSDRGFFQTSSAFREEKPLPELLPEELIIARANHRYQAALAGHPRDMRCLAFQYEAGDGVPVDMDAAIYWYQQAAEKNDDIAKERLQILLGDRQNIKSALL